MIAREVAPALCETPPGAGGPVDRPCHLALHVKVRDPRRDLGRTPGMAMGQIGALGHLVRRDQAPLHFGPTDRQEEQT